MSSNSYRVSPIRVQPELQGLWDGPVWRHAPELQIGYFRPEGSAHRPQTECKLLYSQDGIYGFFRVRDRFVRCVHAEFQAPVYKDSCVEFFVQPKAGRGYFNFEFNCGGALLASYVTDPTRVAGVLKAFVPLKPEDDRAILRYRSLPRIVLREITDEVVWSLEFYLPFAVLERFVGGLGVISGQLWRANFYKCGDETSHPHWGAWAPVSAVNFHAPESFGYLQFEL